MDHIQVAINVLREKLSELNYQLRDGGLDGEEMELIMEESQKLHRAINDISKLK